MRLSSMKIGNYRTLESIDIALPSLYAAICGANDSRKTNVVRAIRALVGGSESWAFAFREQEEFSLKDDFPKWQDTEPAKREISFEVDIELDKVRDVGFYQFVTKQLSIDNPDDPLRLSIGVSYRADKSEPSVLRPSFRNGVR